MFTPHPLRLCHFDNYTVRRQRFSTADFRNNKLSSVRRFLSDSLHLFTRMWTFMRDHTAALMRANLLPSKQCVVGRVSLSLLYGANNIFECHVFMSYYASAARIYCSGTNNDTCNASRLLDSSKYAKNIISEVAENNNCENKIGIVARRPSMLLAQCAANVVTSCNANEIILWHIPEYGLEKFKLLSDRCESSRRV